MSTSTSPSLSDADKQKFFGTLEVKILETREIDINFVVGKVEFTPRVSDLKKHHSPSHQFSEIFRFNVSKPDVELVIEAWRKNIVVKDKLKGFLKINVASLLDEQVHSGWFPFVKPVKLGKGEKPSGEGASSPTVNASSPPITSSSSTTESTEDHIETRKRSLSSPVKKKSFGEIRLEMKFVKNAPPKEVLTGIVLHDQWTKETSGGSLLNNWKWAQNPQFLLNVDQPSDVIIKLRQDTDSAQRASFYVVRYEGFYSNRKKVILDPAEIEKIDNFFCPISATAVDSTMKLEEGRYVIIPWTETSAYEGPFTLAVSSKNVDDLDLYKLPKEADLAWNLLRVNGGWTHATAGGGDILGLNWRKNPQFQLTLTKITDVCVAMEQNDSTRSIGLYVVKQLDAGKKVVDYSDEVGKTDSFKFLCHTGLHIANLEAGSYCIIACTYDADIYGPFQVAVYVNDPAATLALVENEWKHTVELKGAWKEGQSGGSPNNPTGTENPQFYLSIEPSEQPTNVLVQLVQESAHYEEASIGFLVLKARPDKAKFTSHSPFLADDVFAKPEGWAPKVDVVSRFTIAPDQGQRTFVVIPSTFKPDVHRSFNLNVYSDTPITFEAL